MRDPQRPDETPASPDAASLTRGPLLARNTLWSLLGQALPMVAAVLAIPFLVRGLRTERFGILTLTWTVIGNFSLFDFGLGRSLTQVVAERLGSGRTEELPALVWTSMLLILGLSVVVGAVLALATPGMAHRALHIPAALQPETIRAFYLLALTLPAVLGTAALGGVLAAHPAQRAVLRRPARGAAGLAGSFARGRRDRRGALSGRLRTPLGLLEGYARDPRPGTLARPARGPAVAKRRLDRGDQCGGSDHGLTRSAPRRGVDLARRGGLLRDAAGGRLQAVGGSRAARQRVVPGFRHQPSGRSGPTQAAVLSRTEAGLLCTVSRDPDHRGPRGRRTPDVAWGRVRAEQPAGAAAPRGRGIPERPFVCALCTCAGRRACPSGGAVAPVRAAVLRSCPRGVDPALAVAPRLADLLRRAAGS